MSFKAYPEAWATHAALREAAQRWQRRGLLTASQQVAIEAAYPLGYYRPAWWVRMALFIATAFCISATSGSFAALVGEWHPLFYSILLLLGSLLFLELLVRNGQHYRSGADNALLYSALLAWAWLIGYALRDTGFDSLASPRLALWLVPVLLALLLALVRYADPLVAAATWVAGLALGANALLQSSLGRALLPFGLMLAAGALLWGLRRLPARADYFYYRPAYYVLRTLGLATLYLAGNYLVVREGNAALRGGVGPSTEIPFAGLFWALTCAGPLAYLGLALRRHDRLLLWLGMLALAFSIFTLRTYHAVLPPAVAATLAGTLLLLGALAALRYLRRPRHGLTAEADDDVRPPVNLESFVQLETAHVPAAPTPGFEFGGGSTGGGGAEGRF
ncbi:hypothetical protein HHL22_14490 [Hymenobacter sp. RP-2-7]|uniref:DUF2157 domain-containing protein n=1 Tax=Hymenobacter polaris TaxID=2682546 RepID=A0A7Y0FMZ6_9BACT|nr:hypothetical protein [Hymenobacter polaris]NML66417.1 hypothetical protein [Hymenobacter polaris]